MAKKFSELEAKMSPEQRETVKRETEELIAGIELAELRKRTGLSQKELAERLNVQQPAVAKVEARPDLHVSTLREHIEALGGSLVVMAEFQGEMVKLSNFSSSEHRP